MMTVRFRRAEWIGGLVVAVLLGGVLPAAGTPVAGAQAEAPSAVAAPAPTIATSYIGASDYHLARPSTARPGATPFSAALARGAATGQGLLLRGSCVARRRRAPDGLVRPVRAPRRGAVLPHGKRHRADHRS